MGTVTFNQPDIWKEEIEKKGRKECKSILRNVRLVYSKTSKAQHVIRVLIGQVSKSNLKLLQSWVRKLCFTEEIPVQNTEKWRIYL